MKKLFAILLSVLLLAATCVSSFAYSVEDGETKYEIETAKGVSFSYEGNTSVTVFPRGNSKLECLVDGDAAKDVTAHDQDGIVLVCNDYVKPKYEENVRNGVSPAMADQPYDQIPRYSFVLEYDKAVTFDAIYLSLFHEINACVATPGENAVTVEYSKNGNDWTPVGTDGIHYYRACDLPDYIMDAADHNCKVEERIVPLKKEISAKFVRLTFNFMTIPEDSFWLYYTNVFEWAGFTELAVASYKSGDKPEILDKSEADIPDVDVYGDWICEGEDTVLYYSFADDAEEGNVGYIYKEMLASEYEKDGIAAEYEEWESGTFEVNGDKVTLKPDSGEEYEITVTVTENGLTITDGIESHEFTEYTNTVESSEPEAESEPESTAPSTESKDESKEASKNESKEESKPHNASLAPVADEDGVSVGVIIAIAAFAVVVIVAVVVIIVKKKK